MTLGQITQGLPQQSHGTIYERLHRLQKAVALADVLDVALTLDEISGLLEMTTQQQTWEQAAQTGPCSPETWQLAYELVMERRATRERLSALAVQS